MSALTQTEIPKPVRAYDIRKGPIIWLNDLENDKKYKKWSLKLSPLFGALKAPPKLRKNVVNEIHRPFHRYIRLPEIRGRA